MESTIDEDRRRLQRFPLKAFTVVRAETPGEQKVLTLCTQDISSDGAFFPTEVPLPAGEKVRITLFLAISALERFRDVPNRAKITTEGRVIRSGRLGMAVKFGGDYSISPATTWAG
jgi:hypothetical protein